MEWDLRTGDTIVTEYGTYLIIASDGFDLYDDNKNKVGCILVDLEHGSMEGYDYNIDDLWKFYSIREIIKNPKSYERLNG